jgi:DNA-binding response OmpR family regulator/anti-sigma regulatory factor (Ser/Thr protein kinase)
MQARTRLKILIADDNPVFGLVLKNQITGWGYEVVSCEDGAEALRILLADDGPRLALLDWMMPNMDGGTVCRNLREQESESYTYVIILTSKDEKEDLLAGFETGADDYITKPFDFRELRARLRVGKRIIGLQSQLHAAKARQEAINQELRLEIEQRERAERLLVQSERLAALAELASGVAHHFNNMLQVIMGGASVALLKLEMGGLVEAKTQLEQIIESSRFGSKTVKRLQSFVDHGSNKGGPTTIFDLSHTVRQAIETTSKWWKTEPESKGIAVNVIPLLRKGCMVEAREDHLFEVLTNLIRNAAEALPNGGDIRIKTCLENDAVLTVVSDTGTGIAPDDLDRVFDPFFTTKGFRRIGMGLASSYGIIKRLGGTITVQSEPGRGATFTVQVPRAGALKESPPPPVPLETGLTLRILVVDDSEPVLTMLQEGLTELGQTVTTALSGPEALQELAENPYDLVICDLGMPDMNGWEVGRRIKSRCIAEEIPKPRFIMLTGWGGQWKAKEKIAESGVDAVVEKPVDLGELLGVVRRFFQEESQ